MNVRVTRMKLRRMSLGSRTRWSANCVSCGTRYRVGTMYKQERPTPEVYWCSPCVHARFDGYSYGHKSLTYGTMMEED